MVSFVNDWIIKDNTRKEKCHNRSYSSFKERNRSFSFVYFLILTFLNFIKNNLFLIMNEKVAELFAGEKGDH